MGIDYDRLRCDELAAISEFCHTLAPREWDTPSLCEGWRVRDVIGHMTVGYTTPMMTMTVKMARYRFNVPKASKAESIAFASARTPVELLAVFDTVVHDKVRRGISRVIKPTEGLLDHVVHHEDIRRPLGQRRQVPEERLVAALTVAPALGGFVGSRTRAAGLRLEATDVEWRHGDGPLVRGAGEAILLALTGRSVVLDELDGDGVALLKERLAS
jgi:uncharacterized protein (TIGR03083 family)